MSVDFWIARCGNFLDAQTVTVRSQQQLCGCASNILYQVQTVTQAECNEWSPLKKWAIDCPLPSLFSIVILPKGAQDDQKHFPTGFHTAQASLLHFQRENPIDLHLERPTLRIRRCSSTLDSFSGVKGNTVAVNAVSEHLN